MHDATSGPPERTFTPHVYYGLTKSLCATCKQAVDAKIQFADDAVWFDKFCPAHGHQRVRVSSSVEWYLDALSFVAPNTPPRRISKPISGGLPVRLRRMSVRTSRRSTCPVVPITSACNLDCPICYTINKNESAHRMSVEDLAADPRATSPRTTTSSTSSTSPAASRRCIRSCPSSCEMCRDAGIRRLTISTNGLQAARRGLRPEARRARRAHRALARHLPPRDRQASCSAPTP